MAYGILFAGKEMEKRLERPQGGLIQPGRYLEVRLIS